MPEKLENLKFDLLLDLYKGSLLPGLAGYIFYT